MKTKALTTNERYTFDENTNKKLLELGFRYGCDKGQLLNKEETVWIYPQKRNGYSIAVTLYRHPCDRKTWTEKWGKKLDEIRELIKKVEEILKERS